MTLSGPKLGALIEGENSLTTVRLLAAMAVVVSHSFPTALGVGAVEPLARVTPFNLGQHAVNAFFAISGFTLSHSLVRNPDLRQFMVARLLRIFPGLFAFGVVFAFVLGARLSTWSLADYFGDAHTYLYPFAILFSFNDATPPHGLFEATPYPNIVNEPLWTIRYELAAYLGLAALAALGMFRRASGLIASSFFIICFYAFVATFPKFAGDIEGPGNLARFGLCFMIGVLAHRMRDRIPLRATFAVVAIAVTVSLTNTPLGRPAAMLTIAYLVFCLAALPLGRVGRWLDRNDLSYGTYLYGWPIQQALITTVPALTVAGMIAAALPLAVAAGFLSWTLVERPALALKRRLRRPDLVLQQESAA